MPGASDFNAERRAEQLVAMYDSSPVALAVFDRDRRYVWVNERLATLNGIPAADHVGRTVEEIIPELAEQAQAAFRRVLAGEEIRGLELVGPSLARPDRNSVWRQDWVPLRDTDGAIIGIGVSTQDATEERRALRAVEALNRINTAIAGEHDLERLVQMVTDAGVELSGASVGAYFHNVLDDDGERLSLFTLSGAARADFAGLGRPRGTSVLGPIFRNEIIRSDDITQDPRYGLNAPFAGMPPGHPTVTSYLAIPVVAGDGKVLGGLLFGHHRAGAFTQRHQELIVGLAAQAAVAIENSRLLRAVQTANQTLERRVAERTAERDRVWALSRDLLVVISADGVFRSVSPAWKAILGHAPEDVIGRNYRDFLHPEDLEPTQSAVAAAVAGEDVPIIENRYLATDGSIRWISWLTAVEGALIFGSGRDVTESRRKDEALRRSEEALRHSQKMEALGQLTGGVAHDFNNLLTPILGSLDLVRRRLPEGDRTVRLIDGALRSAERASTLVQRLLAFAKRQPLQLEAVDVVAMVADMSALLTATLGPQVRLVVETDEPVFPARGDRNQLEMAVLNLAVNARDAMPEGGVLRIVVGSEEIAENGQGLTPGAYLRLSVTDTGVGMDAATLSRAIEPFFSTKGVGGGSGLGLSMVHGLASQLGGAFAIESSPGAGTSAKLWLPICSEPEGVAASLPEREPRRSARKVLLVDDEEAVRHAVAGMLEELGYEVVEAASAEAAQRLVTDGMRPDLLVSDHLMPGMTGTQLARELRARLPELGVLIVSGYADVQTLSPDMAHLAKPFRESDLRTALAGAKVSPRLSVDDSA